MKHRPVSNEVIRLRKEMKKTFPDKNVSMLIVSVIIMILMALFDLGIFVLFVVVFLVQRETCSRKFLLKNSVRPIEFYRISTLNFSV